ncbi:MAG: ABC transporter permease, partial [Eggerthella lenta]
MLYNLTNINITERQREIATLKVLGFTPREVNAYIYRETMLLSVIGCAVGLVLGVFMEGFVVVTAEVDQVMFGRTIHAASFVIAFLLTMLFTVLVMLAMRRKLARVDMVE